MAYSNPQYLPTVKRPECETPRFRVAIETKSYDEPDGIPKGLPYSTFDVTITILTIIFFFVDVATDLGLAFSYLNRSRYLWFGLTLAFVLVPSVSNSILNLYFYYHDYKTEQQFKSNDPSYKSSSILWIIRIVFTILQMGPVVRNFESLRYGMKSKMAGDAQLRTYYYRWMLREDTDACMLRLFECFMESAPQLTLQLYILVVDPVDTSNPLRIISLLSSWIGISWSLTSYYKSLRFSQDNKENLTACGTAAYFLWRLLEVGPRIVIISMFITQYYFWITVPLSLHWIFVFIWLQLQQLRFCENAIWQTFFNMMCAFVSIFCFLNAKDGTSRYRCMLFYAVFYTENIVLFALWFRFTDHMGTWYHLTAFFFVLCGAVLQAILFCCYYCCCHPESGSLIICREYNSHEMFTSLCFPIPTTQTNELEKKVPENMIHEKQGMKQRLDQRHGNAPHKRSNISMVTVTPPISERSLAMARSGHSLDGDVSSYPSFSASFQTSDTKPCLDSVSNTSSRKTETNV